MKLLKLSAVFALFVGVLAWPTKTAEAAVVSECCISDCYDYYFLMGDNGVPADQREQWLADCKSNCAKHGDPNTCPVFNVSVNSLPRSLQLIDRHNDVRRALQELLRVEATTVARTGDNSVGQGSTFASR